MTAQDRTLSKGIFQHRTKDESENDWGQRVIISSQNVSDKSESDHGENIKSLIIDAINANGTE